MEPVSSVESAGTMWTVRPEKPAHMIRTNNKYSDQDATQYLYQRFVGMLTDQNVTKNIYRVFF